MDTFHCSFFFFSLSILTVLSLFAPVTSPTVSLPLSPFFCLGNSPHPTPGVQTGGAASGLLPAWVPAASEQPQRSLPGRVQSELKPSGLCPRTERLSPGGKRMVSLQVLQFPSRVSVRTCFRGTSRPVILGLGGFSFRGVTRLGSVTQRASA